MSNPRLKLGTNDRLDNTKYHCDLDIWLYDSMLIGGHLLTKGNALLRFTNLSFSFPSY